MADKLTIQASKSPAVTITRAAVKSKKLVYIAVTNRPLEYERGRSCIVYIGTTKKGAHRMAASAASKAHEMLGLRGVRELSFFVVTCRSRQNVKTWRKLERGLLISFKEIYGKPPVCNTQGKNMKWTDEREYFRDQRLVGIIARYSNLVQADLT